MNRILDRGDACLNVTDVGVGTPVIFQHGLGGDDAQARQTFPATSGRRLTLECRGHGHSSLGSETPFSFDMFAADVLAAVDTAGIHRFVAGGVSMGAGIAMRLAKLAPERVTALILVRPAWTFSSAPANLEPIAEVAELLRKFEPSSARANFGQSQTYRRLGREAPDNLASLLGYFERPDATAFAAVLQDIVASDPGVSASDAQHLRCPTLVIGNALDAIHPLAAAHLIAETIPRATCVEVVPKATGKERHFVAVQAAISAFLNRLQQSEEQTKA